MDDLDRDGNVLGAELLAGLGSFNTNGNLHLVGTLGDALKKTLMGDLNDAFDDLLHRDGNTVRNDVLSGARNFIALNSIYVVRALDCALDNLLDWVGDTGLDNTLDGIGIVHGTVHVAGNTGFLGDVA